MDIDMQALRGLENEKEIRFDVLVDAIEQALTSAYHKTPGAFRSARAHLDRDSGTVTIFVREDLGPDEDGVPLLCLETALPAKFEDSIVEALGRPPERPTGYENIEALPQRFEVMDADVSKIKDYIARHAG